MPELWCNGWSQNNHESLWSSWFPLGWILEALVRKSAIQSQPTKPIFYILGVLQYMCICTLNSLKIHGRLMLNWILSILRDKCFFSLVNQNILYTKPLCHKYSLGNIDIISNHFDLYSLNGIKYLLFTLIWEDLQQGFSHGWWFSSCHYNLHWKLGGQTSQWRTTEKDCIQWQLMIFNTFKGFNN